MEDEESSKGMNTVLVIKNNQNVYAFSNMSHLLVREGNIHMGHKFECKLPLLDF